MSDEPQTETCRAKAMADDGTNPTRTDQPSISMRTAPWERSASEPSPIAVPGYEILGELGRGGMGVVYLARQSNADRLVALKMVLAGGHTVRSVLARFRTEIEAAARLQHPNIVAIFEVGECNGCPFYTFEYCPKGTLAQQLAGTPRVAVEAAALIEKLAGAVQAAHDKGVLHRDLKPANVLLAADGTPKITDFGIAKKLDAPSGQTGTEAILGTPSYMAPEQAMGQSRDVGPAVDVYALGAILYEALTGRPPFRGATSLETLDQVRTQEPLAPRLFSPKVPRDLETICLKCLRKEPARRYATAAALAGDLRAFLEGRPITARPVGRVERALKWIRRHPARSAAFTAVVLIAAGAAVGINEARKQQEAVRREARANSLVQALGAVETAHVPRLLDDFAEVRAQSAPKLRDLATAPVESKPGLHARLALLADDPDRVAELAGYLPVCRSEELLPVRELLKPHAAAASPPLWAVLQDNKANDDKRLRAACGLAGLASGDPRWDAVVPAVATALVRSNSLEAAVWAQALDPVAESLLPSLLKLYVHARTRMRSGNLEEAAFIAEATASELTASLLARFAASRPKELAELATTVDFRHFRLVNGAIASARTELRPILRAELQKWAAPNWQNPSGATPFFADIGLVGGTIAGLAASVPDSVHDELAKRKANAAAALLETGDADSRVWDLFKHSPDPSARSYLIHRVRIADPLKLLERFKVERDLSARRALLLALGEHDPADIPVAAKEGLVSELLTLYREHSDPGLHSSIDWLLRQRWDRARELATIDVDLAQSARGIVRLPAVGGGATGAVAVRPVRDWFVNGVGQTYAVVRGPVSFRMGSPVTEPKRVAQSESLHRKEIGRTFAIATREVSLSEFLRFRPRHAWMEHFSPRKDNGPAVAVTWYDAAAYCNWLSAQEGIPPDQWCYEPSDRGEFAEGMTLKPDHMNRSGYRLPSEAEWEYACRAGSVVARSYGRGEDLLGRYAWYRTNARDHVWPGGRLKPNDLGLFDMLGNALEWVTDPALTYNVTMAEDRVDLRPVDSRVARVLRGGSLNYAPENVRCAVRSGNPPDHHYSVIGFRPARTLP